MARVESAWTPEQSFKTNEDVVEPPPVDPPDPGDVLHRMHYHEDFSGGSNGQRVDTYTGLTNCTQGYCDTSRYHPQGSGKSMRSEYKTWNGDAWNEWGFVWESSRNGKPGPLKMHRYGEIWMRVVVFYPSNWDWTGGNPDVKGFRFYYSKSDGSQGDTSLGYTSKDYPQGDLRTRFTNYNPDSPGERWPNSAPAKGQWTVLEAYQVNDYIPKSSGGQAQIRFWRNGVAWAPQNGHDISNYSGSKFSRIMYHTYVNEGFPQDQDCWIDSFTMAFRGNHDGGYVDNAKDMPRDSTGFPHIGTDIT